MKKMFVVFAMILLAAPAFAQELNFNLSAGGGIVATEAPSWENAFASVQVGGLDLPLGVSSGVGADVFKDGEWLSMPGISVWSLNRVDLPKGFFTVSDVQLYRYANGDGGFNFDLRLGGGFAFGDFKVEVYNQDDKPIAVAFFYNF
jgi:hypothetical protein